MTAIANTDVHSARDRAIQPSSPSSPPAPCVRPCITATCPAHETATASLHVPSKVNSLHEHLDDRVFLISVD